MGRCYLCIFGIFANTYWHNTPQNRWHSSRHLSRLWQSILLWNTTNTPITQLYLVYTPSCTSNSTPNVTENCGYTFHVAPRAPRSTSVNLQFTLFHDSIFWPKMHFSDKVLILTLDINETQKAYSAWLRDVINFTIL